MLDSDVLQRPIIFVCVDLVDLLEDVQALNDLPEHCVLVLEFGDLLPRLLQSDEECARVEVWAKVSCGEEPLLVEFAGGLVLEVDFIGVFRY